jgi:hypothetical protein
MTIVDKREAVRRATRALESGRPGDAIAQLWPLVDRAHALEAEIASYVRLMGQAYAAMGRPRAAGAVALYLGDLATAERFAAGEPRDLARVAIARRSHAAAARHFLDAGCLGQAAIQLEEARDDRGARVLWERLCDDPRLRADPYTHALVRFNLGRAALRLGDREAARRASVQSMHLLESAADLFEQRGLRERAFDCYQVLISIGRDGGFENLAEGYINCIRILREDNLKIYVLQYFDDFQKMTLERGELAAAATSFREAAEFCRRHGLPYERHYRMRAAETHVAAGEDALRRGAPAEMCENAFTSALDDFADLGAWSRARDVYARLAQLDLPDKRRARYARLYERLGGVPDEQTARPALPDYMRADMAYPEVWRLDVVEWERDGDAAEAMSEVLLDEQWPDGTRRRALLWMLKQLGTAGDRPTAEELVELAQQLGRTDLYTALSPLERLYAHPDARVRAGCLRALRQLYFKRSFVLVSLGLRDPDGTVRSEALAAASALHFSHAFDPLARIYRESTDLKVRRAVLGSIARIQTAQAVEMLVDVLRHGDGEERRIAREALARSDNPHAIEAMRQAAATETGPVLSELRQLLQARGLG